MKKLLFFKSSSSHGGERREVSTATRDKRHHLDTRWKKSGSENVKNKFQNPRHFSPDSERKVTERRTISRTSSLILRKSRSLSMSSSADGSTRFGEDLNELRTHRKFPSNSGVSTPLCDCSDCHFQFKDRDSKPERFNPPTIQRGDEALYDRGGPGLSYSSSPRSSFGSTSFPDQVLDLYIDGEYFPEKYSTREHHPSNTASLGRSNSAKQRSNSSSLSNLFLPPDSASRASLKSEKRPESPRKLAKEVVERLLRLEQACDSKTREICDIWPPVPTTLCDKQLDESTICSKKGDIFLEREDDNGSTLEQKLEEANERAMLLARELSQERPFQYYAGNVAGLSQMIRKLLERERKLVVEFSDQLQCRIAERTAAKEAVSLVKEEMNSMVVKLERENDELQYRLRELTEQNVSLQKEVSSFYEKEKEYIDKLSCLDVSLKDMTAKVDVARSENDALQKMLSEIQDKLKVAEEVQFCMERNFKEKEKENTGLIKAVARLQGTCNEQERTIDGLHQSLNMEMAKQQTSGKLENVTHKLQMEQLRLTGVEQVLRRQLESCTVEAHSLRHENIYLLERLKATGKVSGHSAIKLDQELLSCVQCLQNIGLTVLNDSIQMSARLIGILKSKRETDGFMEVHTLIDYDAKVQGFKQAAEQLTRSLGKAASVLSEKAEPGHCESELYDREDEICQNMNRKVLEKDDLKAELKAERLLTSLLKENLFHKEKEVELIQAELARASRNVDVLKSEIQDAFDTVSCVNHKMKNLELQMMKKDGTINQLQGEVHSHAEELSATKGILSKVTQERDLMWEEVKQYSEKNMLLNCEVNSMKKKIEALEEDTLLKDGQISILKDSLNNARPFDVLFTPEHGNSFKL